MYGSRAINWQSEPASYALNGSVEVGRIKINVAVGVGVCVGVFVGGGTVGVAVGDGSTKAVWVCAAPAVPAMMVSIGTGSEPEGAGAERTGSSHASKASKIANKRVSFFDVSVFMIVALKFYWTSMTNLTSQKSFLPTLSDHLVE